MSRLIIKNLPSYITNERLKELLLQKNGPGGTITDVKVAVKSDGASRRFAFVGFKTDEEASKAQQWLDRTYIDTTRINVQVAENSIRHAPTPRPNKKPRLETNVSDKNVRPSSTVEVAKVVGSTATKPAELDEFMTVMQPRTKKVKTWANDDGQRPLTSGISQSEDITENANVTVKDDGDVTAADGPEQLDDMEWLKRRTTKADLVEHGTETAYFQDEDRDNTKELADKKTNDVAKVIKEDAVDSATETILKTGRLFLRNLPFSCTDADVQEHFSSFGQILQAHIPVDASTRTSKGLGFVTFADPSCALKAYEDLDKTSFQGRVLHILPAVEKNGMSMTSGEGANRILSVRGEKEKKRKDASGKDFNWSMLYMNSDAVASSIADRMNVSKADILNPESGDSSAAVKLALAETHVVQETKTYLENEGINLSSFSSIFSGGAGRQRRSETCILVKNIPYGTTAQAIRELFESHGELSRVLVPPAGTIAVVDFTHADEAAKAFKAVAYKRLGSSIIYLEKAPMGVFDGTPRAKGTNDVADVNVSANKGVVTLEDEGSNGVGDSESPAGSTLYVKNLSFATTTERLTTVFRHLPFFGFARVQTKPDLKHQSTSPGEPAPRLSMGFGFIGFKSPDAAKSAMRSIQGFVLDGHALSVKFSGRGVEEAPKSKEKVSSTTMKMIVKNVPFEVTKKEIRELFGAHGQLKSVRVPKKMNARSRGFAFLDFVSRHEAENAYSALKHTHLLGRHLVLEWADDSSQDIDLLRKKAGVGYGDGGELPGRKRKFEFHDDEEDGGDAEE